MCENSKIIGEIWGSACFEESSDTDGGEIGMLWNYTNVSYLMRIEETVEWLQLIGNLF